MNDTTFETCWKYVFDYRYKINGKYFNIQQNIIVNNSINIILISN